MSQHNTSPSGVARKSRRRRSAGSTPRRARQPLGPTASRHQTATDVYQHWGWCHLRAPADGVRARAASGWVAKCITEGALIAGTGSVTLPTAQAIAKLVDKVVGYERVPPGKLKRTKSSARTSGRSSWSRNAVKRAAMPHHGRQHIGRWALGARCASGGLLSHQVTRNYTSLDSGR